MRVFSTCDLGNSDSSNSGFLTYPGLLFPEMQTLRMVLTVLGGGVSFAAAATSSIGHANELLPTVIRYKISWVSCQNQRTPLSACRLIEGRKQVWIVNKSNQLQ
jgi:hypothetical protein